MVALILLVFLPHLRRTPKPPLFPYTTLFRSLFLSGDRDPFARIELLKDNIKLIPNARLEVFEGQGHGLLAVLDQDRKSTRLNSSHRCISYAVFCLKKKKELI